MANGFVEREELQAIADAIRAKNGSETLYKPAEMAEAILAIPTGEGGTEAVLAPLEVTENGDYFPEDGIDGFSSVSVNVESSGQEEPALVPLEVTQNGVYLPGDGVDGYSEVVVNVPSSAEITDGIVVNAKDANGYWTDITIYGDIPANRFKGDTYLQRVTLADNVTSIGASAFSGCTGLAGIIIPANIASIGNAAFYKCTGLASVRWEPVAVDAVGSSSGPIFEGCTKIASVTFADNVQKIPNFLFREATGSPMGDVVIPEGVTYIGKDAFYGCGLTSVTIPSTVTEFGTYTFYKCTSLTTVYWNAPNIASVGTTQYPIFDTCSALVNFIIGENVTVLPAYMLRECTGITSIVIPNGVTTIGTQAFYSCSKLASVQIGTDAACAISSIGTNAFGNDSALTDITIYAVADAVSGSPWGATNATVTWLA